MELLVFKFGMKFGGTTAYLCQGRTDSASGSKRLLLITIEIELNTFKNCFLSKGHGNGRFLME